MKTIPIELYNNKILEIIIKEITYNNSKYFYEFDELNKDNLISIALESLNNDVEIILSRETNKCLSKYLSTHNKDDLIEFKQSSKLDAYNHFEYYFDLILNEQINEITIENMKSIGFYFNQCKETGETLLRKSA